MADSSTGSCTAAPQGKVGMEDKGNGSHIQKVVVAVVGYCRTVPVRTVGRMLDHGGRGMKTMAMLPASYEMRSPSHWC